MNVTIEDLILIIGRKEAEIFALQKENAQLRACLPSAAPKDVPAKAEAT